MKASKKLREQIKKIKLGTLLLCSIPIIIVLIPYLLIGSLFGKAHSNMNLPDLLDELLGIDQLRMH